MTRRINLDALEQGLAYCMSVNGDSVSKERLEPISDQTPIHYNSVNIFCGKQGSGKTYSAFKEIIKISHISPETHLVIIITKDESEDDATITAMLPMIRIPVIYVKEDDAEDFVKSMLEAKRLYNQVMSEGIQPEGEQLQEMMKKLFIHDFSRQWLHTVLLFNDIAKSKLFKKAEGYFNQLIPICRHIQCSFFLNIQFWKGINPEIKVNLTTAFIFGGFSKEQLQYILRQLSVAHSFYEVFGAYKSLEKYQKLIVDNNTGEVYIE